MQKNNSVYFPNLDGIRFIAAFLVIINHVEQISEVYGIYNWFDNEFIKNTGKLGVSLFFVLSGFLITFLLYKEESVTNTISLKWFYVRRILRIWPLYFLIIILGLFVYQYIPGLKLPGFNYSVYNNNLGSIILLFIFFMPNIVLINFGPIPFVAQTWSIGAEEQFYLFWPALNKYIKSKLLLIVTVFFIFFSLSVYFSQTYMQSEKHLFMYRLIETIPIHYMCIGAFFAYVACNDFKIIQLMRSIFFSRLFQLVALLSIICIIVFKIYIPFIQKEYFAFIFGVIIYNAALNDKNIFLLNNKVLTYLGKISYGLYMYHPVVIVISVVALTYLGLENNKMLVYILALGLSILIAAVSYEFFEKYFFKLKNKFKIV